MKQDRFILNAILDFNRIQQQWFKQPNLSKHKENFLFIAKDLTLNFYGLSVPHSSQGSQAFIRYYEKIAQLEDYLELIAAQIFNTPANEPLRESFTQLSVQLQQLFLTVAQRSQYDDHFEYNKDECAHSPE